MPFDMPGDIEVLERLFALRVLDLIRAQAAGSLHGAAGGDGKAGCV